jgi:hypothetical protein
MWGKVKRNKLKPLQINDNKIDKPWGKLTERIDACPVVHKWFTFPSQPIID